MLCVVLVVVAALTMVTAEDPMVTIPGQGPVSGFKQGTTIQAFMGIPFSAPPVGNLRWKPPMAPDAWAVGETYDAKIPKLCFQSVSGSYVGSEADCNNINIWKPDNPYNDTSGNAVPMPVMVWIHGGSYTHAAPDLNVYNGTNLVLNSLEQNQPTIVVSIQYRMGGLGFMGHKKLKAEAGSHDSSGNYGMLDQLLGLQWIQDKIHAFGGDSSRVTIFGESAGAYSVCTLLASPLATGLFSGAIAESAYCANSYLPSSYAEGAGTFCAKSANCASSTTDDAELTCLRDLPVEDAYGCTTEAYANAPKAEGGLGVPGLLQVMPNIDGYVLRDAPLRSIAKGTCPSGHSPLPSVPVIFGSNSNEMTIFAIEGAVPGLKSTPAQLPTLAMMGMSQAGLSLAAASVGQTSADVGFTASNAAALAGMYKEEDYDGLTTELAEFVAGDCDFEPGQPICETGAITNTFRRIIALSTDQLFTSTAAALASAMVERNIKTFRYLFDQPATGSIFEALGPFHSEDVPFVFGTFEQYSSAVPWDPPQAILDLGNQMQTYWLNFANTGDPNYSERPNSSPVVPVWIPTTVNDGDQYMTLRAAGNNGGSANSAGYRLESVNFWRAFSSNPLPVRVYGPATDSPVETNAAALIALIVVAFATFGVVFACKYSADKSEAIDAVKDAAARVRTASQHGDDKSSERRQGGPNGINGSIHEGKTENPLVSTSGTNQV